MNNKKSVYEIITLNNILKRHLLNIGKCEIPKSPPSPIQIKIMHYLIENNDRDIYQRDLEKILNLRRSTISGILKTMEKHNIIIRNDSKIDSRSKKIELSSKTKDIYEKSKKVFDSVDFLLCKNISSNDLNIFFNVIGKMKENLENNKEDL